MREDPYDIFRSDQAFITMGSTALVFLGMFLLVTGLGCRWLDFPFCRAEWLSFFPTESEFNKDFTTFNLSLGMLITGGCIRMYSRFGWIICLSVVVALLLIFLGLSIASGYMMLAEIRATGNAASFPFIQALITNICFFVLCLASFVYLMQSPVRKLYGITI